MVNLGMELESAGGSGTLPFAAAGAAGGKGVAADYGPQAAESDASNGFDGLLGQLLADDSAGASTTELDDEPSDEPADAGPSDGEEPAWDLALPGLLLVARMPTPEPVLPATPEPVLPATLEPARPATPEAILPATPERTGSMVRELALAAGRDLGGAVALSARPGVVEPIAALSWRAEIELASSAIEGVLPSAPADSGTAVEAEATPAPTLPSRAAVNAGEVEDRSAATSHRAADADVARRQSSTPAFVELVRAAAPPAASGEPEPAQRPAFEVSPTGAGRDEPVEPTAAWDGADTSASKTARAVLGILKHLAPGHSPTGSPARIAVEPGAATVAGSAAADRSSVVRPATHAEAAVTRPPALERALPVPALDLAETGDRADGSDESRLPESTEARGLPAAAPAASAAGTGDAGSEGSSSSRQSGSFADAAGRVSPGAPGIADVRTGAAFLARLGAVVSDQGSLPTVPDQLVRALHMQWRAGFGEARVQLHPEHLGHVTVTLKVERGGVMATVRAEAPAVQQWVEAHAHQLRDSLDGVGLRLDDLVVTAEDRRQRGSHEREDQRPARRRPQPREIAVRFEVLA